MPRLREKFICHICRDSQVLKEIWKVTRSRLASNGAEDSLRRLTERRQTFPSYLLLVQTEEKRNWREKELKGKRKWKEKKGKEKEKKQNWNNFEVIRDFPDLVIFTLPESLPLQFKIIAPWNLERKCYDSIEIEHQTGCFLRNGQNRCALRKSGKGQQHSSSFSSFAPLS